MRHFLAVSGLAIALALATSPVLAQMAKEGKYNGTYSAFGTMKTTQVGKNRLLMEFDENGLTLAQGFSDHLTHHCWGIGDFINGEGQEHGYCVGIDPSGDQVVLDFQSEQHAPDQKTWRGRGTLTTGTGKYAGISGGHDYVVHGNELRTATEGNYTVFVTYEGAYQIQAPSN